MIKIYIYNSKDLYHYIIYIYKNRVYYKNFRVAPPEKGFYGRPWFWVTLVPGWRDLQENNNGQFSFPQISVAVTDRRPFDVLRPSGKFLPPGMSNKHLGRLRLRFLLSGLGHDCSERFLETQRE